MLTLLLTIISTGLANIPKPYSDLSEILPLDPHHYYTNRIEIAKLCSKIKPSIIIELGAWLGHSTNHFAKIVGKNGKVYAVDHWLGSIEHIDSNVSTKLPSLYDQFLSNVIHFGETDVIIPVKATTNEAVSFFYDLQIKPDLIYVDAAHDEESVYQDIVNYFPLIKGHGVICGDDYSWGNCGVKKAVDRFAKENNLIVETSRNWFWLLKEK